jgi:hypothetical protein
MLASSSAPETTTIAAFGWLAVVAGHGEIEQDDVRLDAIHQLEQVVAPHRGTRDLEPRPLHSHLQCLQEKRMIIR